MSGREGKKEFHLCCLELLIREPFPPEYMMYTNVVMLRCPLVMSSFGCKCSPMTRERGTDWSFLSELASTFPVLAAQQTCSLGIDEDLPHSSIIERCWWFLDVSSWLPSKRKLRGRKEMIFAEYTTLTHLAESACWSRRLNLRGSISKNTLNTSKWLCIILRA